MNTELLQRLLKLADHGDLEACLQLLDMSVRRGDFQAFLATCQTLSQHHGSAPLEHTPITPTNASALPELSATRVL